MEKYLLHIFGVSDGIYENQILWITLQYDVFLLQEKEISLKDRSSSVIRI